MINQLLAFIIIVLLAGCAVYVINWFVNLLNLPQPIKNVVLIVIGVIGLIWLLSYLGLYSFPH